MFVGYIVEDLESRGFVVCFIRKETLQDFWIFITLHCGWAECRGTSLSTLDLVKAEDSRAGKLLSVSMLWKSWLKAILCVETIQFVHMHKQCVLVSSQESLV